MEKMIFLDSSFLIAYYNDLDYNHIPAIEMMKKLGEESYGDFIISDYVFGECVSVILNKIKDLEKTVKIGEDIMNFCEVINVDQNYFNDTFNFFKEQENRKLSFTDCSILAVMKNRGIKEIATFDSEFKRIKWINVI